MKPGRNAYSPDSAGGAGRSPSAASGSLEPPPSAPTPTGVFGAPSSSVSSI
ncbi:MAG TPA: hypothetical protein VF176_09625 [Solirubrobacterales bacterium]